MDIMDIQCLRCIETNSHNVVTNMKYKALHNDVSQNHTLYSFIDTKIVSFYEATYALYL